MNVDFSFPSLLYEGLIKAYVSGSQYISVSWVLGYIFIGSFLSYAILVLFGKNEKRTPFLYRTFHFSVCFRSVIYLLPDRDRCGRPAQKIARRKNASFFTVCVRTSGVCGPASGGLSRGVSAKAAGRDHAVWNRRGDVCRGDSRLQNGAAFS